MLYLGTSLCLTLFQSLKQSSSIPRSWEGEKSGRKISLEQKAADITRSPVSEQPQIQLSTAQDQSILHLPSDLDPIAGKNPLRAHLLHSLRVLRLESHLLHLKQAKDPKSLSRYKIAIFCHLLEVSKCVIFPAFRDDTESLSLQTNTDTKKNQRRDFLALEKGR